MKEKLSFEELAEISGGARMTYGCDFDVHPDVNFAEEYLKKIANPGPNGW